MKLKLKLNLRNNVIKLIKLNKKKYFNEQKHSNDRKNKIWFDDTVNISKNDLEYH